MGGGGVAATGDEYISTPARHNASHKRLGSALYYTLVLLFDALPFDHTMVRDSKSKLVLTTYREAHNQRIRFQTSLNSGCF